jgi:hypothetical protein
MSDYNDLANHSASTVSRSPRLVLIRRRIVGKELRYFQINVGPRVKSPPIEDLSRYVDAYGQTISKRLRKPPTTKPK